MREALRRPKRGQLVGQARGHAAPALDHPGDRVARDVLGVLPEARPRSPKPAAPGAPELSKIDVRVGPGLTVVHDTPVPWSSVCSASEND